MSALFKIEAMVHIRATGGRTWPIRDGYRPGFCFAGQQQTSGAITWIDRNVLNPGASARAIIAFVSDQLLGPIQPGTHCPFYEGPVHIGDIQVLRVIGWETQHTIL